MLLNLNESAGTLTCGANLYHEMVSFLEPADFFHPPTITLDPTGLRQQILSLAHMHNAWCMQARECHVHLCAYQIHRVSPL